MKPKISNLMFQGEVAEHVVSYQPGAKASSDFATFPVTSFVKVQSLHTPAKFYVSYSVLVKEMAHLHI